LQQFESYNERYRGFNRVAADFVDPLVSHYVFDGGRLVVTCESSTDEVIDRLTQLFDIDKAGSLERLAAQNAN
jgi:hypothetical protein